MSKYGTVALSAILVACGGPPPVSQASSAPEYPGELLAPAELRSPVALGNAFALEQRVRTEYPDGSEEFRAVLQLNGDQMVLIGFGPHGGRGFTLQQDETAITFDSQLPRELPFPPDFMLRDIQRVWFHGLQGPLPMIW